MEFCAGPTPLELDEHVARGALRFLRTRARIGGGGATLFALGLEREALGIETFQLGAGAGELVARTREGIASPRAVGIDLRAFGLQALAPQLGFLGAGAQSFELTQCVGMRTVRGGDARLGGIALAFGLLDCLAQARHALLRVAYAAFQLGRQSAQHLEALLAFDHAGMRVPAARDAQPVAPHPLTGTRDNGLVALERMTLLQGAAQVWGSEHPGQAPQHRSRSLDVRGQRVGGRLARRALLDERDLAGAERRKRVIQRVEPIDTHRVEIVTDHHLDGALPARVDADLLGRTCAAGEARFLQPGARIAIGSAERGLLQRLERHLLGLSAIALVARTLEARFRFALLATQRLHARQLSAQRLRQRLVVAARIRFTIREPAQRGAGVARDEVFQLDGDAVRMLPEATQLVLELLHARALDLGGLVRAAERTIEFLPALLPRMQRLLGLFQGRRTALLLAAERCGLRLELRDLTAQPLLLLFVARDLRADLAQHAGGLRELHPPPLTQLARVLQRLLRARDLRAERVAAPLHLAQAVGLRDLVFALLVERRLGGPLLGELLLQHQVAIAHGTVVDGRAAVDLAQAQGEQLGGQPALVILHFLVAPRCGRLALQVADLLLDLVAQVLQALEVLARLGDPALGLAAALLVARYARGLLDERAHLFRTRLDDARDHALLDDRVAARAQSRAEEQLRDVLAAAAGTVDEVHRGAVARHEPLQRDLVVARVGAADLAVRVVEHQLDRRRTHRLARAGTVEDDVGHGVAAQMARGQLAHDPAHGVDDVGLAATVRTYDARQVGRKLHGGGIDEGLETGQLDLGEAHRAGKLLRSVGGISKRRSLN